MMAHEVHAPQLEVCMTACEVRALQLQARHSISVVCGARITIYEVCTPQFGACMTACEVHTAQLQAHNSCGACT